MAKALCTGCNELFSGEASFNKHRIGNFYKNERRCLSPEEMTAKGMAKNTYGQWVSSLFEERPAHWQKETGVTL